MKKSNIVQKIVVVDGGRGRLQSSVGEFSSFRINGIKFFIIVTRRFCGVKCVLSIRVSATVGKFCCFRP